MLPSQTLLSNAALNSALKRCASDLRRGPCRLALLGVFCRIAGCVCCFISVAVPQKFLHKHCRIINVVVLLCAWQVVNTNQRMRVLLLRLDSSFPVFYLQNMWFCFAQQVVNTNQRMRILLLRHISPPQANQLLLMQDGAPESAGAPPETEEDLISLFGRVSGWQCVCALFGHVNCLRSCVGAPESGAAPPETDEVLFSLFGRV